VEARNSPDTIASSTQRDQKVIYAVTLLLVIVATLFVYKAAASLAVIQKVQNTGAFQPRLNIMPMPGNVTPVGLFARSVNYFSLIWPALLFGILISGAVRVLDPPSWLARGFGRGRMRSQLAAGLAGAPLMLCSCCVAPVFSGLYERSSKLGPSLAVMLAAPALNPAAMILTFMLFAASISVTRLVTAACAVFFTGVLVERFITVKPVDCVAKESEESQPLLPRFVRSCGLVAIRTVPLIVAGVLISMAVALWLPVGALASSRGQIMAIITVALIAVPLAMPTFFEIPLALLLLSAGAPAGAAVAMMIAGPAINLPSLFAIAHSTNWRVASAVAAAIFLLAVTGGLLVSLFWWVPQLWHSDKGNKMKLLEILLAIFICVTAVVTTPFLSSAQDRTAPVAVGEIAPDFTLEDHNKSKVSLSTARGKSPVVLVFFRGYWWPFCARQLAALRTLLKKDENVKLYAISIDAPDVSKEFAKKLAADGKGEINFPILSDTANKVIDEYGLRDPAYKGTSHYGIPHPAVYVIDKHGKVAWAKIESNYRERPSHEEIRAALDALD
jgi:uncharacterized protein